MTPTEVILFNALSELLQASKEYVLPLNKLAKHARLKAAEQSASELVEKFAPFNVPDEIGFGG